MFKRGKFLVRAGLLIVLVFALCLTVTSVFAANTGGTGQPNQDCESIGVTPGHAASASGSAFNPDGKAGTVYAGEQPQNSKNPLSVSQYDVACFQVSQH